eukprot:GEZU01006664.1.p1 GENE.GEZU01006664.1~~GEZU01006664.1.p1  ORF type:complete len:418 (+),score=114.28 GEZU01006664.1:22-1254(+)
MKSSMAAIRSTFKAIHGGCTTIATPGIINWQAVAPLVSRSAATSCCWLPQDQQHIAASYNYNNDKTRNFSSSSASRGGGGSMILTTRANRIHTPFFLHHAAFYLEKRFYSSWFSAPNRMINEAVRTGTELAAKRGYTFDKQLEYSFDANQVASLHIEVDKCASDVHFLESPPDGHSQDYVYIHTVFRTNLAEDLKRFTPDAFLGSQNTLYATFKNPANITGWLSGLKHLIKGMSMFPLVQLQIYLPPKDYENISMKLVTGDIIMKNVNAHNMTLDGITAEYQLSQCRIFNSLAISSNMGETKLEQVAVGDSVAVESNTSDIEIRDTSVGNLATLKSNTGEIKAVRIANFNGTNKKILQVKASTNTGDIQLRLAPAEVHSVEATSNTGDITIFLKVSNKQTFLKSLSLSLG